MKAISKYSSVTTEDPGGYSIEEACAWVQREMFFEESAEKSFLYMKHLQGEDSYWNNIILNIYLNDWIDHEIH